MQQMTATHPTQKSYKDNQSMMDPILSSLPHLSFQDAGSKIIGTIKRTSPFYTESFRSVAYKGSSYSDCDTKNAIASDFHYKIVLGRA